MFAHEHPYLFVFLVCFITAVVGGVITNIFRKEVHPETPLPTKSIVAPNPPETSRYN